MESNLAAAIEVAGNKAKYDAHVKMILADKKILSWILKYSVEEFKESSLEEIECAIEGSPDIASV